MADSTVARRYAQAMIEVASEADVVDQVGADLTTFSSLLDAEEGMLGDALRSPVFTVEERRGVLDEVLPKLDLHALTANLLRVANDKGRLSLVTQIAHAYGELADERAGRLRVVVQTAEPLSEAMEAEVASALEAQTGKKIVLQKEVDPDLIGGLIARVGGKVYDSSIRTRLEQIKGALLSGTPAQA
ncbi:MAG: ATP synthase F1 subunit delta [Myxococcales bacterium]|nr:ATP synthase F1 subunit delta [Myxococcales bacterium]